MPANVLVILDATTQEVRRVVVPDHDAQLDKETFHGSGEVIAKVDFQTFLTTPDLAQLQADAIAVLNVLPTS
jgi:hypothetical protein